MAGPISRKRVSEYLIAVAAALFIAVMPLIWIRVASPLGDNLRLTYFTPFILLAALSTYQPWFFSIGRALALRLFPLLATYSIYLIILTLFLAKGTDVTIVRRQIIYIIGALIFGLALGCCAANRKALRLGGLLGVVSFVICVEIYARSIGTNLVGIFQQFVLSGDLDYLVFDVWREIFRSASASPEDVAGSEKNIVSVALLLAMIFVRIGGSRDQKDWLGRLITLVCAILLILLNTRIVLISLVISLLLARGIHYQSLGLLSVGRAALNTAFAGLVALSLATVFLADSTAAMTLFDRFAFEDHSAGSRVTQLKVAFDTIESSPWLGGGLTKVDGSIIHNFFFAAWVHAGFLAFLLTVVTYVIILRALAQHIHLASMKPNSWTLPIRPEWVATLPVFSLLSPWVSGDAGHPSVISWVGIIGFLTLVWLNERNTGNV